MQIVCNKTTLCLAFIYYTDNCTCAYQLLCVLLEYIPTLCYLSMTGWFTIILHLTSFAMQMIANLEQIVVNFAICFNFTDILLLKKLETFNIKMHDKYFHIIYIWLFSRHIYQTNKFRVSHTHVYHKYLA